MDIAALSMQMSAQEVQVQKDVAVMKLSMDTFDEMAEMVVNELVVDGAAINMAGGGHIDMYV